MLSRGHATSAVPIRALRGGAEGGSTLVLFPVAVLIVLGLGALAVDSAVLFLGQRRLADLAAAIASDSVAAIDQEAFYGPPAAVQLDQDRAERRAQQLVARRSPDRLLDGLLCTVDVEGARAEVSCEAWVRPRLAPVWPGLGDAQRVTAVDSAVGLLR